MNKETWEKIEKENWKKAKGIKVRREETNSALAERNYSIKCETPYLIAKVKGYHIWWCSTHHQPLAWCEKSQREKEILEETEKVIKEMEEVIEVQNRGFGYDAKRLRKWIEEWVRKLKELNQK